MKKINLCLIKPDKYIHSYAFWELGELLYYSLQDLGYEANLVFNKVDSSAKNIIIGCHLLSPKFIAQMPKSTVILNTEQIYNDATEWNANIFAWVRNFEIWDYSTKNIEKFKALGFCNAKHLKIGFQKELVRIQKAKDRDIDVLFYGSVNDRRKKVLDQLVASGLTVKVLFGVYGKERDRLIERSKIVLNHHFYNSKIFEIIRVFYLLTNSIAVVGEVSESTFIDTIYRTGIYEAKYDDLVAGCIKIVRDDITRDKIEEKALESISKYPQKLFTLEVLDS